VIEGERQRTFVREYNIERKKDEETIKRRLKTKEEKRKDA